MAERQLPDVANLERYIQDRARILTKLCADHLAWDAALKSSPTQQHYLLTWIDQQGTRGTVIIDRVFLSIHWRMIRTLILDLADCGSEARKALRQIAVSIPSEVPR